MPSVSWSSRTRKTLLAALGQAPFASVRVRTGEASEGARRGRDRRFAFRVGSGGTGEAAP